MAEPYSVDTCRALREKYRAAATHRPMRVSRYEPGDELTYEVRGVIPARPATVRVRVERFVGGGFAGQVYRVHVEAIDAPEGPIAGLCVGGPYAMKILVPPSSFSRAFRDAVYAVGFQGPFAPQVSPAAARAGALWQKLVRRGAGLRFGSERAVVDILATFVDRGMGSCGELSEWVEGRTWLYEVDDRLDARKAWARGRRMEPEELGSPEYRAKKAFMAELVRLLHDMGTPELARQYEWWTCKSQPNVLKRLDAGDGPADGLTAVDFRAGLALLAFAPMSPGDVPLVLRGLMRGALVQFDRGDLAKLRAFIGASPEPFGDVQGALEELEEAERAYRDGQLDITHHHVRLLHDGALHCAILDANIAGWEVSGQVDERTAAAFRRRRLLAVLYRLLGLVPLAGLVVALFAFAGGAGLAIATGVAAGAWAASRLGRKLWGRADVRRHLAAMLGSPAYLGRAVRAHVAESLVQWVRAGRASGEMALRMAEQPWRYAVSWPLGLLPAGLHRVLTDAARAKEILVRVTVRPVRLYFDAAAREHWLRQMVEDGRRNHMLTGGDAERILSRIGEPFIQKYLKSLAVHVCTLPVTQIVSVSVAWYYVATHPELSAGEAAAAAAAILAAFQLTPISPGSLVRGLYVVYLVVRERNFRDYHIAVFLGFFKYVGYLAFPIQMAYRYPVLARFMAGHWATGAVHVVPVFGERGALLEHWVFDLFYNRPLTTRRLIRLRAERRAALPARRWHAALAALAGAACLVLADVLYLRSQGRIPALGDVWPATLLVPTLVGWLATALAGGSALGRRIALATLACLALAGLHFGASVALGLALASSPGAWALAGTLLWRVLLFGILGTIAAVAAEVVGIDGGSRFPHSP